MPHNYIKNTYDTAYPAILNCFIKCEMRKIKYFHPTRLKGSEFKF